MDHLGEIAIFVAVVDAGSFSAAAGRLELSRGAISKAVSRLEDRLGARLLHRTTRSLSLTEAGQTLYASAKQGLQAIERAQREIGLLQSAPRGALRLSAPLYFGVHHLAPVIAEYLLQHPDTRVDAQFDDRFVDLVDEGFDLAVRIGALDDSSLVSRKLAPSRLVVCAAPEYWRRHGEPTHPAQLAQHDCFVYTNLDAPHTWRFVDPAGGEIAVPVHGRLSFNNTELARHAAIRGLGVIQVPTFYISEQLRTGQLRAVLPHYPATAEIAIHAVYPARQHLPAKVRAFIDLMAERFGGDQPYWERA
jgi:DNA-binding transcriptional LysR family regulator